MTREPPPEPGDARWLELVEGVVHDLRTPLATVTGYLELLALGNDTLEQRQREHVARAAQAARELARQIELALLVARLEAGSGESRIEERELVAVVDLALLRLGDDERARVAWRGREPGAVSCDPGLLGRAAGALVARALARSAADEAVELSVVRAGDRVRLEVRDRGAPIPPEQLEDLFRGFGSPAGRRRPPRLELLFGRLVAESLGGRAGARSAKGETVLWLELPAAGVAAGDQRA